MPLGPDLKIDLTVTRLPGGLLRRRYTITEMPPERQRHAREQVKAPADRYGVLVQHPHGEWWLPARRCLFRTLADARQEQAKGGWYADDLMTIPIEPRIFDFAEARFVD
jgi:hypothetical protein